MKNKRWSNDQLIESVRQNLSLASVLRDLNLKETGGNYIQIKRKIQELNLDTSHFTGAAHLKGKNHDWTKKVSLAEILVIKSKYQSSNHLKKRLIKESVLEYRCSNCKNTEWMGKPIPLQLDHINGIKDDNRLENLRLLCPNCHAQTDTYCGKNIGKVVR